MIKQKIKYFEKKKKIMTLEFNCRKMLMRKISLSRPRERMNAYKYLMSPLT